MNVERNIWWKLHAFVYSQENDVASRDLKKKSSNEAHIDL